MRILQVVTHLGLGGAERVAEALAVGVARRGIESTVFAVAAPDEAVMADAQRTNLEQHGVTVVAVSRTRDRKLAALQAMMTLRRLLASRRPDLVHLHTEIPELTWALTTLVSRVARSTPVVRTIHNATLWPGWAAAGSLAESRLDGARVVAVSGAALAAFTRWHGDRPPPDPPGIIINNGVEELPMATAADHGPPLRLLFAGRFELQKGIDILLDALLLVGLGPELIRVEILGGGRLANLVEAAVVADPRRLRHSPPRPDLRNHLDGYDAILMPSRFEGLPVLAIEGLSAGIPILATHAPGLDDVFPAEYPHRCAPDPAEFASLIRTFAESPEAFRQAAIAARPWARERYSIDRMLDGYEAVYQSVAAGSSIAPRR